MMESIWKEKQEEMFDLAKKINDLLKINWE
jgi:hypothetical protein